MTLPFSVVQELFGLPPTSACHSDMTSMSTSGAKIGRPSLVSKFPGLVQCAAEFIKQHCFSAHSQQRQETGMAGVSPAQIRDHLEQNIPDLKEYGISNHCFSLNGPS